MTKYIECLEPYSNGDSVDCLVRVTVEEAIKPREISVFPKLMEKLHGFRERELVLLTSISVFAKV